MQSLAGKDGIYVAPSIPARKEKNARAVHAEWLPPDEPIAVLFDDTVFGAGDDGYVVTPLRICWRNFSEDPQMVPWPEVTSLDFAEPVLNGKRIKTTSGKQATLMASVAFFSNLAASSVSSGTPAIRALAAEPCKLCGGGEYVYFPKVAMAPGDSPAGPSFQVLVCRTCRQTHFFDVDATLDARFFHQVLKAPPQGPYR